MKGWIAALALTGALGAEQAASPVAPAPAGTPARVRLETAMGVIEVEVDPRAPVTAANFLRYVEGGYYTGARFHRTVRAGNQPDNKVLIDVIQAGRNPASARADDPPIPLERTSVTGLRHVDGALSMARDGADTATSDFFICIGDQPELDFGGRRNPDGQGFAVFGRVVAGMDVVRKIHDAPADGQALTPPVAIRGARVVRTRSDGRRVSLPRRTILDAAKHRFADLAPPRILHRCDLGAKCSHGRRIRSDVKNAELAIRSRISVISRIALSARVAGGPSKHLCSKDPQETSAIRVSTAAGTDNRLWLHFTIHISSLIRTSRVLSVP